MIGFWVLMAAAMPAAEPTLMLAEARAMPPAVLADRLLGADHDPVSVIAVHPTGMDAPSATITGIDLRFVARAAREPDFCAARVVRTAYAPTDAAPVRSPDVPVPARAGVSVESQVYRWTDRPDACSAGAQAPRFGDPVTRGYLTTIPGREAESFALVRRLAWARKQARGPGRLPFAVTFDNAAGDAPPRDGEVLTDARAALAALAVEWVAGVEEGGTRAGFRDGAVPAGERWSEILIPRDLAWWVRLRMRGDTLVGVDLRRITPAPF